MLIDGADLTQMATGINHEFRTLQNNKPAIIYRVAKQANPEWFSLKLQEEGMILTENASAIVNNLAWSDEVKVDRLIQAVESKLRHAHNPAQIFQEFVEILQREPALKDLAQKLQTGKYTAQSPYFYPLWQTCSACRLLMCHMVKSCFRAYRS